MMVNGLATFCAAFSLLRLGLAVVVLAAGVKSLPANRPELDAPRHLRYLGVMAASLVVVFATASWPLLLALLASFVSLAPGAMCIFGVLQSGGQAGIATTLLWLKPLLTLGGGIWLCLYAVNSGTRTGALAVLAQRAMLAIGAVALLDAVLELLYVVLPRPAELPPTGCCLYALSPESNRTQALLATVPEGAAVWLFYAVSIGVSLGALLLLRSRDTAFAPHLSWASLPLLASAWLFAARSLSPRVLHQPGHYCLYDLIGHSPLAVAGGTATTAAAFCLAWAGAAAWASRGAGEPPSSTKLTQRLLRTGMLSLGAGLGALTICLVRT